MFFTVLPDGSKQILVSDLLDWSTRSLRRFDQVIVEETGYEANQSGSQLMGYKVSYISGERVVEVFSTTNPKVLDVVVNRVISVMLEEKEEDIMEILTENYYSIGVRSGKEAIENMRSDLEAGHFAENLVEWTVSEDEMKHIIAHLYLRWVADGRIDKAPVELSSSGL